MADAGAIAAPPEDVRRLWRRYREGQDATTHYPLGHPAPSIAEGDAWLFAPLGQFLYESGSPLGRRCIPSELHLARLRNTLAHGHDVCWRHVRGMQQMIEALAP